MHRGNTKKITITINWIPDKKIPKGRLKKRWMDKVREVMELNLSYRKYGFSPRGYLRAVKTLITFTYFCLKGELVFLCYLEFL